jgi:hypothetical protein
MSFYTIAVFLLKIWTHLSMLFKKQVRTVSSILRFINKIEIINHLSRIFNIF